MEKTMPTLASYLKGEGAIKAEKVIGPNGAFISATKADGSKFTLPVGKKSQDGSLKDYNVLITDEGAAIATVNQYESVESIEL